MKSITNCLFVLVCFVSLQDSSGTQNKVDIIAHRDDDHPNQQTYSPLRDELMTFPLGVERGSRGLATNATDEPEHGENNEEEGHGEGEDDHDEHGVGTHVTYEDIYDVLVFLGVAFVLGNIASMLGMPSLVGEIIAGFLLGPPLADFVPYPESMVLLGEVGLILLLLEAGIDIDVSQLKQTGSRSLGMALTGSMLPLLTGFGIATFLGKTFRQAVAIGAAFSPTSLGVASNALSAGKVLNTPVGQLIVAAGVLDDILGLLMLSMLEVLVKEDPETHEYFIPAASSFGLLFILGLSAVTWMPKLIERILHRVPENRQELVAFMLMQGLMFAYMPLMTYAKASYLMGVFLAGLAFSQVHVVHAVFLTYLKDIMIWLLRIFFAASIGFQVPIKALMDVNVLALGLLFYIPVIAKLPLGFFVPLFETELPKGFPFRPYKRDVLVTSVAMTCRGEFSFIIASFALSEGLLDEKMYSAIVFAVLLSTMTSPFVLVSLIRYYNNKAKAYIYDNHPLKGGTVPKDGRMPLYLVIQARTPSKWGLQGLFKTKADEMGLIVLDHRSWSPRGVDTVVVTEMYVQDTVLRIKLPGADTFLKKLAEFENAAGAVGDKDASHGTEHTERKADDELSGIPESEAIEQRCQKIRQVLLDAIDMEDSKVQVAQWKPYTFDSSVYSNAADTVDSSRSFRNLSSQQQMMILEEVDRELAKDHEMDMLEPVLEETESESEEDRSGPRPKRTGIRTSVGGVSVAPAGKPSQDPSSRFGRAASDRFGRAASARLGREGSAGLGRSISRRSVIRPPAGVAVPDVWVDDLAAVSAVRAAVASSSEVYEAPSGPSYGTVARRRRRVSIDEEHAIEEHLEGIVRHEEEVEESPVV